MLKIVSGKIVKPSENCLPVSSVSPQTCIYFVLSGKGTCDNRKLCVGDGFFVKKDAFIQFVGDKDDAWTYACFCLDGEAEHACDSALKLDNGAAIFKFDVEAAGDIILSLCKNDTYISLGDAFDTAAASLVLALPTSQTREVFSPRIGGKQHVEAAKRYIRQNLNSELKVEQIAHELGIERKYLRNLFVKHQGISTMDYIIRTRMERAKELLCDPSASVTLVANSVGYRDVLAFSKAFKNYVGVSPTDYRRNLSVPTSAVGKEVKTDAAPKYATEHTSVTRHTAEPVAVTKQTDKEAPKAQKRKSDIPIFIL